MDAKGLVKIMTISLFIVVLMNLSSEEFLLRQNPEQFSSTDPLTGKKYRPGLYVKRERILEKLTAPNLFYPLISPDGTEIFPIRS